MFPAAGRIERTGNHPEAKPGFMTVLRSTCMKDEKTERWSKE